MFLLASQTWATENCEMIRKMAVDTQVVIVRDGDYDKVCELVKEMRPSATITECNSNVELDNKMDDSKQAMRGIIQKYVDDLKALLVARGDTVLKSTMYGGRTLSEEIKLAEER